MTTASGKVLLLTHRDVDVVACQFLDSDYAADAYINWPLERRLEGFLRNRGMARVADDGDTCDILRDRVMSYINVVPATCIKAKTS
jgi:hypothetical protein